MEAPDWVVWYDDGSSITSAERNHHDLPRWGVMCIATRSLEHGRTLWTGDFYVWDEEGWIDVDLIGLLDYLTQSGREKLVLVGRNRGAARFQRIYKQALDDPRLPAKSSTDWLEERRNNTR